jgi:hypothetical protein
MGELLPCACIEKANEKLAERNGELVVTIWPVARPVIETQKKDHAKRGRPPMIVANFCPFCGTEYPCARSAEHQSPTDTGGRNG